MACNSSPVLTRVVSDSDKQDLKEALKELVDGGSHNAFGAVSCQGFSTELVNDVINNSHRLFTIKDVFQCLHVYSIVHSFKILELIQEIFEDIPNFNNVIEFVTLVGTEHLDHASDEQATNYFDGYFDLPDDDIEQ